ncbi:MAG: FG-GAP-like repeat-containing protein [Chloroflexota bacterium]
MNRYTAIIPIILLSITSCGPGITETTQTATLPLSPSNTLPPTSTLEPTRVEISFINSNQRLGSARSWDVSLGDLDGDGDLDAFVANDRYSNTGNAVWLNDGQGLFTLFEQDLGFGNGIELGDVDGDSDLDALITDMGDAPAILFLNNGDGTFTDSGQNLIDGDCLGSRLGDLDGDGDPDAYFARGKANSVWLNDGSGIFSDTGQILGEAITDDVALADFDGDGDLDALAGGWDEHARLWLNDGSGNFTDSGQELTSKSLHIHGLDIGDLDGDHDLDVFMAIAGGINQTWFNDGFGTFNLVEQDMPNSLNHMVSLGDLDGDGDLDAFVTNALAEDQIWLNDGSGMFTDSGLRLSNEYSIGVQLGDLDGDGDLDAFVTHGLISSSSGGGMPNEIWLNESKPLPGIDGLFESYTRSSDGMVMLFVPGGNFQMGSSDDDLDATPDEFPQRSITLDAYWIDQTEVSNAQYVLCVEQGKCRESRVAGNPAYNGSRLPVTGVSWQDAVDYCEWAGGRIPTEAEWEYASKGRENLIYPWGNEFDGSLLNFCDANCDENWAETTINDGYTESAPVDSSNFD